MKKLVLITGFLFALLVSCKKDDNSLGYDFKDQNLSGKFNDQNWSMLSGRATLNLMDQSYISVTCYAFASNDPCSADPSSGNEINFTIPKRVGVYKLYAGSQGTNNGMYVYFIERSGTGLNGSWRCAYEGAVEITFISETEVKGKIDASYNNSAYYVNGNFTVKFCDNENI